MMAAISPFVVGLLLHWIIVAIVFRHPFSMSDHMWSLGLSLFLGGLGTSLVLNRIQGDTASIQSSPGVAHTQVSTEDQEEAGLPSSKQESPASPESVEPSPQEMQPPPTTLPTTPDGLWRMASQPQGTDHLCFVAPNQIAAIYMAVGLLLVLVDLLNAILAPLGGLFAAILWIILLGVAYFLKVMVCSDPNAVSPGAVETTELPMTQVASTNDTDSHPGDNSNGNVIS